MATLESYSFGSVVVDGREETSDLIVLPARVVREWWRASGHLLTLADLAGVLEEIPERLVVGTGTSGMMAVAPDVITTLKSRGVTVEVLRTADAVRRYAELDPAKTAAALHLTC